MIIFLTFGCKIWALSRKQNLNTSNAKAVLTSDQGNTQNGQDQKRNNKGGIEINVSAKCYREETTHMPRSPTPNEIIQTDATDMEGVNIKKLTKDNMER